MADQKLLFNCVNEEGVVYDVFDTYEAALDMLRRFPNDSIIAHFEGSSSDLLNPPDNLVDEEWAIIHPSYPTVAHRGPMPEDEARAWMAGLSSSNFPPDSFYLARRDVGEWKKVES